MSVRLESGVRRVSRPDRKSPVFVERERVHEDGNETRQPGTSARQQCQSGTVDVPQYR